MVFLSIFQSVLAAMFGVQSSKKYHRDFKSSHFWPYAVIATLFVVIFVVSLIFLVDGVIATAQNH
ncbi:MULTISPECIES: DUF2970 domain-containing protein [Pseudoalteromonas]|nr:MULTISPECIES: DUF2970 domain-containing protein [Pseudoalteromonas]MCG7549702.1 DUF2970 domain-containing protein [Pseudoalteromonas sp. Of7M-16]